MALPMMSDDPRREAALRDAIDTLVAPMIARDDGTIAYSKTVGGVVEVVLGGACLGCPAQRDTLLGVVLPVLRRLDPSVTTIRAVRPG